MSFEGLCFAFVLVSMLTMTLVYPMTVYGENSNNGLNGLIEAGYKNDTRQTDDESLSPAQIFKRSTKAEGNATRSVETSNRFAVPAQNVRHHAGSPVTPSMEGKFKLFIFPATGQISIGEYQEWIIVVRDHADRIVEDAYLAISGGMIAHGHGLPSKPQIQHYLGEGRYLIEGVLFNMAGTWTLQFIVQTKEQVDRVRFDFEVAF